MLQHACLCKFGNRTLRNNKGVEQNETFSQNLVHERLILPQVAIRSPTSRVGRTNG